ncbi:MAG TPA: hypothetical protein VGB79_15345 [Allosphingosinicella sp.]|jgi:cell division protein FtsW (lipid II flippase)
MQTDAAGRRTLLLFALASLAAVAAGAATLAAAGSGSWLRNPIAWCVGALLGGALYAGGRASWVRSAALVLAPVGLAATLVAAPVDGVHRWIDAGPLHVNLAALLLPAMIVAAGLAGITSRLAAAASAAAAILLVLQPDASQATALAAAAAVLLARSGGPVALRAGLAVLFAGAAAAAWLRPDPLQPVAEVEEIFGLAFASIPILAGLGALALAAAAAAPLGLARRGNSADAALALFAYFAVTALAPLAGAYPVPLMGLGMSFPVGWWLGAALLCAGIGKGAADG